VKKMKRNKFNFVLGAALAVYANIVHAFNFTECKLEPEQTGTRFAAITAKALTQITYTDPDSPVTQSASNLRNFLVKSNLPPSRDQNSAVSPVIVSRLDVYEYKELIKHISLNTARGTLDIIPWFFTDIHDRHFTGEVDRDYTFDNYIRPKQPKKFLEWRAEVVYAVAPTNSELTISRMAECHTYFGLLDITEKEVGTQLSLDDFKKMFPYVRE
jgi:hypothetical protein